MKNAIATIFVIIFAAAVLTFISFLLFELFLLIDEMIAAFIVIEFTMITGIITICYLMRKWTKKDTDRNNNERNQ